MKRLDTKARKASKLAYFPPVSQNYIREYHSGIINSSLKFLAQNFYFWPLTKKKTFVESVCIGWFFVLDLKKFNWVLSSLIYLFSNRESFWNDLLVVAVSDSEL